MKKSLRYVYCLILFLSLFITAIVAEEEEIPVIVDVEEIKEAGPYYMQLYAEHEGVRIVKLVLINITAEKTVVSEIEEEAIDASDFFLGNADIYHLSSDEIIYLANAHAWRTDTGERLPVQVSTIEKIEDYYVVTFETAKGTKTSVNAFDGWSPVSAIKMNYRKEGRIDTYRKYNLWAISISLLNLFPCLIVLVLYIITKRKEKETALLLFGKDRRGK